MSFLDDLISDQQFNEFIDQGTLAHIENLIWHSSLDEKQKHRLEKRMLSLETQEGVNEMINYLMQCQPIVGIHRAPMTQYESVAATRYRVELENFKERGKEGI